MEPEPASSDPAVDSETLIADAWLLARNMMEVHGIEAAVVARENARAAALDGRVALAKSWIKVLGIIQQHPSGGAPPK